MGDREIIEQQQARIAGLEADLATQIQIGVTDAEEMDRLAERAEIAESALAQAEAREAETFDALDNIVKGLDGRGYAVKNFPALSVARRRLAATPERITAAAEILRLATHGAGINFTLVTNAVRRYTEAASLDQPETG